MEEKEKNNLPERKKVADLIDKKAVYATLVLSLLFLFLLAFFAVRPQIERLKSKKAQFEQEKITQEVIKWKTVRAESFSSLVREIQRDGDLLNQAVIRKDSEVDFIAAIERIAKQSAVEIAINHYIPPKKKEAATLSLPGQEKDEAEEAARLAQEAEDKKTVRLLLGTESNYKNFLKFFYLLENMNYMFNVESIDLSKPTTSNFRRDQETAIDQVAAKIIIGFIPQ